jgi:hypothetical protein
VTGRRATVAGPSTEGEHVHDSEDRPAPWVPPWFQHPGRTELATGHHLRPLRAADDGLPGLPPDLDVLTTRAAAAARTAYVYGVFDDEERTVLGVVRLVPGTSYDAEVSWSLDPVRAGADLGPALAALLPDWLERSWPFASSRVSAT